MFQALKTHILKEREKKKQEQEADAEVERQRKEREAQQKQNVMTLGENREQIAQLEAVLAQLKDEKHQLFLKLKKVLNEDDNRRRQLLRQQETSFPKMNIPAEKSEVMELYGGLYSGVPQAIGGHISHLVMQQNYVADRALYKVPPSHTLLPPTLAGVWSPLHPSERGSPHGIPSHHAKGSLKRTRSPSPPPPQPSYPQNYGQKPPSRVAYQKSSGYGSYYPAPGTTGGSSGGGYTYSGPQFVPASSRAEQPQQPENIPQPPPAKHPVYMSQPLPRPSINQAYMHTSIEHNKPTYSDEKFYTVPAIRPTTHVPLHGGAIPIQQPAQGAKTGGITSGYPIRPPSSAPPPPHVASTPTTPHYVSQAPSGSRLVYSQAGLTPTRYVPREV